MALAPLIAPDPALAAGKAHQVYTPQGPWALEYADDACRLIRTFTHDGEQVTLAFERFELSPTLRLGL